MTNQAPLTSPETPLLPDGRISSAATGFLKWFPIVWTAASLLILCVGIGALLKGHEIDWVVVVVMSSLSIPVLLIGLWMTWLFGRCADEVAIHGEQLVIRKGTETVEIPRQDISTIKFSKWINPPIGTIELSRSAKIDQRPVAIPIKFFAPMGASGFSQHPKVKLIESWIAGGQ